MKRLALTAFVDVLFLVVYIFFLMPHNPAEAEADEMVPPGSVVVIAEWTPGLDVDIDLWVRAPGDTPVGYSNKGSKFFNLLRDDLGMTADSTPLNIEYSFTRGQPAGEYQITLHYFGSRAGGGPVSVHVEVSMRVGARMVIIHKSDVVLEHLDQEVTVWRWTLDENSNIIGTSMIPVALRSGKR